VNKKEEVTGGWRKLHNEGLHSLYSLLNISRIIRSRMMRGIGHVAQMGDNEICVQNLFAKSGGKR
jgi:hypothetical protein